MSELIPGLPPAPPPSEPRTASAVILWREGPRGREIFWVKRGGALRFAGGFQAFPGGRLDEGDARVPVPGFSGEAAALRACATREIFEETGVLLATGRRPPRAELEAARRALLAGGGDFGDLLARHGLAVDGARLHEAGRWITPPQFPLRYDAHVFLAALPEGEAPEVWPGELTDGEWIAAADAEERWASGEVLLHPPNLWGVQCLARGAPPGCLEALRSPPATEAFVTRRIEFQRGLFLASLRTPTLPPATHTNAWIPELPGRALAVVDPGSPWPEEQAALDRVLADLAAEGLQLREVWVTHHHADHVGGIAALRERHDGLAVRAHRETAARLPPEAGPVAAVADGDLLHGRWRALHTPGHAPGHLAFLDERTGALLAGDMVSTLSTIVIDPPEGDMAAYLGSLRRLRDLGPRTLFPAHGAPTQGAVAKLEEYLRHREEREAKVVGALPGSLEEVTARAYDDAPPFMLPVAARSCLASLEKLAREGRVQVRGQMWSAHDGRP
ncbi:MAG TPA: MBL fold metallo-hydrolase [Anaeromyxobacteraceae bacterium]|nr:MBL fold metallo-hydrolase [Anaeromyxobacteraceae bacterium]